MSDVREHHDMYPEKIRNFFGWDNETLWGVKQVENKVPVQWLNDEWHYHFNTQILYQMKLLCAILSIKSLMLYGESIMLKICTVFFEGKYHPNSVSQLYRSLKENSSVPFEFICLADRGVDADIVLPYNKHSNVKKHWHKLKFLVSSLHIKNLMMILLLWI